MNELIENIDNWAKKRGLDKSDPHVQLTKVMEELGELSESLNKDQHEKLLDAFGDVQVTLIILAMQLDLDYEQTLKDAYSVISNRTGKTVNGVFVKDEDLG